MAQQDLDALRRKATADLPAGSELVFRATQEVTIQKNSDGSWTIVDITAHVGSVGDVLPFPWWRDLKTLDGVPLTRTAKPGADR